MEPSLLRPQLVGLMSHVFVDFLMLSSVCILRLQRRTHYVSSESRYVLALVHSTSFTLLFSKIQSTD